MTQQLIYALDLVDELDLILSYEACHKKGEVLEAILMSIREAHIEKMQIFRIGNRLVMIMAVVDNFDPRLKAEADAQNADVIEWDGKWRVIRRSYPSVKLEKNGFK